MSNNILKVGIIFLIISAIIAFFALDLGQYTTLSYLKNTKGEFVNYYKKNTITTIVVFFAIYVSVTTLSLPGAAIMTIAAGSLFGTMMGIMIVSFASAIGATLAFLISRLVFRDFVQKKFGEKLSIINAGVEKEGAFYLFALRLVPVFPFFIINIVMGLTKIKTITYYWVSQIGMLAGTIVYVYAGTQLAQIESLGGILNPQLIGGFVLLGIFPIIARKIISFLRKSA